MVLGAHVIPFKWLNFGGRAQQLNIFFTRKFVGFAKHNIPRFNPGRQVKYARDIEFISLQELFNPQEHDWVVR